MVRSLEAGISKRSTSLLRVCLAFTMCFGINFSKVFASGYVTDDLTVKIGYWGMDEIESFLGKGVFTPNFELEFVSIKDTLLSLL